MAACSGLEQSDLLLGLCPRLPLESELHAKGADLALEAAELQEEGVDLLQLLLTGGVMHIG